MAAITTVLSLLEHADHLICIDAVYGGTQRYLRNVYKGDYSWVDFSTLENVKSNIKPNTKMMWIESPTNPTLNCIDI
jgi:cystathionine beta-lyase/cystathionine gamma-synthase